MSDETWRQKYRVAKLAKCLECGEAKAAEFARRLSRLTDSEFEDYADSTGRTLAELKTRAGLAMPAPVENRADRERCRASIDEFIGGVFGLDEYFAEAEQEEAREGRKRR